LSDQRIIGKTSHPINNTFTSPALSQLFPIVLFQEKIVPSSTININNRDQSSNIPSLQNLTIIGTIIHRALIHPDSPKTSLAFPYQPYLLQFTISKVRTQPDRQCFSITPFASPPERRTRFIAVTPDLSRKRDPTCSQTLFYHSTVSPERRTRFIAVTPDLSGKAEPNPLTNTFLSHLMLT
jgi:hypothetical protein